MNLNIRLIAGLASCELLGIHYFLILLGISSCSSGLFDGRKNQLCAHLLSGCPGHLLPVDCLVLQRLDYKGIENEPYRLLALMVVG